MKSSYSFDKYFYFFLRISVIIILSLSHIFWNCKTDNTSSPKRNFYKHKTQSKAMDFSIEKFSPDNGLLSFEDTREEVKIIFSEPILNINEIESSSRQCAVIEPSVKGEFRWLNSRTCTFIPSENWKESVEYSVTVYRGITSFKNTLFSKPFSFSFKREGREIAKSENNYDDSEKKSYGRPFYLSKLEVRGSSIHFNSYGSDSNDSERVIGRKEKFLLYFTEPLTESSLNAIQIFLDAKPVPSKKEILPMVKKGSEEFYYPVQLTNLEEFPKGKEIIIKITTELESIKKNKIKEGWEKNFLVQGVFDVKLAYESDEKRSGFEYQSWRYSLEFSNDFKYEDMVKSIQFEPEAKNVYYYSGEKSRKISLRDWDVKPGKKYKIKIKKFKDDWGNLLTEDKTFDVEFENRISYSYSDYNTEKFSVIEASLKQRFPVFLCNTPELGVEIKPFTLEMIQNSLEKNSLSSDFDSSFFHDNSKLVTWKSGFKTNEKGRGLFDFSPHLKNKKGWLGIHFQFQDFPKDYTESHRKEYFIQSTDIGITAKDDYASGHIWLNSITTAKPLSNYKVSFFDSKLNLGTCTTNSEGYCKITKKDIKFSNLVYAEDPIKEDTAFTLLSEHNLGDQYCDKSTDAWKRKDEGFVFFDRKLYRPGEEMFFTAALGYRSKGRYFVSKKEKWSVSIVNPQGASVYNSELTTSEEGLLSGNLKIPMDSPLGHYHINLDRERKAEEDITFFRVYDFKKGKYVEGLQDTFQVEEFRPVSFAVEFKAKKDQFIGEKLDMEIQANYLFGAPLQKAPISYTLKRYSMLSLNFPEYKDYKFGDSISSYDSSDNGYYTGKTGNLDFKGKYKIDLDLRPLEIKEKIDSPELEFKMSNSYSLDFETTIKDVDEKTVTNRSSVNVFNGKILPGIKIISPTYQKVNSKFIFDLLTVNHSGKPVPSELDIRVIQTNWNSIATKASGNATQNKNTEIKKLVHREVIRTGSSPYRFTYKPSGTGNFTLTVQLKNGVSYSKTSFYSYDEKSPYNKWYHSSDSRMEVSSEKNIYSPGDTAKILVKSPFPKARAVISVEREKVLWQQTLNLENTSVPIEIPIKPEYIPNVSVKVAFFSPRSFYPKENQVEQYSLDQKDIGVPEFKLGKVNLKIESSSKILPISITLDKLQYVPQEEVTMTISSAPNTEVSLSVADEAVLNLIGYGYSNPAAVIYDSWGEGVFMMENRRYLIHQLSKALKGANPGGDFYNPQEGSGGFYLDSEEGRKNIKYTAYQNPLIKLGSSGTQKIKFKLPDNITSFKIMAIASNNGSYGIENHSFKVRKSVVVQKSVPAFIRPGDNLLVGGIVINQTGFDMKFKVSYKTNLLKIEGKDTEEIFLKEGERKEVAFKVQLDETKFKDYKKNKHEGKHSVFFPGEVESWIEVVPSGKIDGIAKKANRMVSDYSDKLFIKFPIKTETPQESIVISGSSKGNINEKVKIPSKKEILQDVGEIEFGLSNTALIGLEKAFQYYAANPYFCAEQRSSAFLLRMSAGELLKEFSVPVPKGEGYDFSVIDKLFLEEIGEFQNSDGGFRLWKKGTEGDNPYLSVYVAFVLQAARKQGFKADETVYKNSLKYVKNFLTKNTDEEISYLLDTLSLASYILSNEGEIVRYVNDFIYNNRDHLSLRARAFLLMAFSGNKSQEELKNDAAVNTLLKEILTRLEEKDGHISTIEEYSLYSSRSYYNSGVALGNVLQALIKVDPRNAIIPKIVKTIVESKKRNIWESTSSSGNLALGLKEYRDNYEIKGFEPFSLKTALNSNLLGEIGFAKKEPFTQKQTFQLFDLDSRFNLFSGVELNFSINGVGNYYYNLKTSFTKLSSIKPQDNGIEIHRHIYDPDVNNLSEIYNLKQKNEYQRGKIYFVRLVVYSEKDIYNLVIEDPIPSNMEIVNTAFLTENSEFKKLEARQKYSSEEGMLIEKREDRYLITQDSFASGQREYFYLLRPIIKGTSFVPAPKAKMMYQNSVNGRGAEKIFSVK